MQVTKKVYYALENPDVHIEVDAELPASVLKALNLGVTDEVVVELVDIMNTGVFYKEHEFKSAHELLDNPIVKQLSEIFERVFKYNDFTEDDLKFLKKELYNFKFAMIGFKPCDSDSVKTVIVGVDDDPLDHIAGYYDQEEWEIRTAIDLTDVGMLHYKLTTLYRFLREES